MFKWALFPSDSIDTGDPKLTSPNLEFETNLLGLGVDYCWGWVPDIIHFFGPVIRSSVIFDSSTCLVRLLCYNSLFSWHSLGCCTRVGYFISSSCCIILDINVIIFDVVIILDIVNLVIILDIVNLVG